MPEAHLLDVRRQFRGDPAVMTELLGGRIHTDLGFALSWGAFPALTAYVAAWAAKTSRRAFSRAAWSIQADSDTPSRLAKRRASSIVSSENERVTLAVMPAIIPLV